MLSWLAHGCSASGRYHEWPMDALWEWMESDLDVIMVGTWMLCGKSGLGWLVNAGFRVACFFVRSSGSCRSQERICDCGPCYASCCRADFRLAGAMSEEVRGDFNSPLAEQELRVMLAQSASCMTPPGRTRAPSSPPGDYGFVAKPGSSYSSRIMVPRSAVQTLLRQDFVEKLENGVCLWRQGPSLEEQTQALLEALPPGRQRDVLERSFAASADPLTSPQATRNGL